MRNGEVIQTKNFTIHEDMYFDDKLEAMECAEANERPGISQHVVINQGRYLVLPGPVYRELCCEDIYATWWGYDDREKAKKQARKEKLWLKPISALTEPDE